MQKDTKATVNAFLELYPKVENQESANDIKAENDREILISNLRFAENVFPDGALTLCPVSHPGTNYFSQNSGHVLGHPREKLMNMPISEFIDLTHPDDLPLVQQCFNFIKQYQPFDYANQRFVIYYRLKNEQGEYMHMRNENLSVKTEKGTYLFLMIFNNISEEKFYHVKLEVSKKINGKFVTTYTYNPKQSGKPITPRQNDIARLISRGFSNQEIADHLNVSIYTVKNHKQMLFKKVKVKNSVELANYIQSSGF